MLVKELIERLKKVDGDLPVSIDGCDIDADAVTVAPAAHNGGYYFVKEYNDRMQGDVPTCIKVTAIGVKAEINLQGTFDIFLEYPEIEIKYEGRIDQSFKDHIEETRSTVIALKKEGGGIV